MADLDAREALAAAPMAPSASPKLDVLRSVAVLTVAASHLWFEHYTIALLGRMGVLLFFVHTSLVLMFSLERQEAQSGRRRFWTAFMVKRVLRIYPLAILVVAIVFAFAIPSYVFLDNSVHFVPIDRLAFAFHLLLVQDVFLTHDMPGPMMGVLWTLPIEMRMYLFLPLIYLFVRTVHDIRILGGLWVLSVLGALGTNQVLTRVFGSITYNAGEISIRLPRLVEYIPYFLAGVLAYVLWRRIRMRLPFAVLPVFLGVSLLGFYLVAGSSGLTWRLNVFGMMACLAIAVALPAVREPAWRPLRLAAAELARLSYAIYLIHVPMIWLCFGELNQLPAAAQWLLFVFGTIALSTLLHLAVERPFIRLGARLSRSLTRSPRPGAA
jgi:peptidoglycan/LPS O-acetylase OafA/YrhL